MISHTCCFNDCKSLWTSSMWYLYARRNSLSMLEDTSESFEDNSPIRLFRSEYLFRTIFRLLPPPFRLFVLSIADMALSGPRIERTFKSFCSYPDSFGGQTYHYHSRCLLICTPQNASSSCSRWEWQYNPRHSNVCDCRHLIYDR